MSIKCRLCYSENTEIFYKLDVIDVDYFVGLDKIILTECKNCGFCFNSAFSQKDCNKYYEESTNYTQTIYKKDELKHDRFSHLKKIFKKFNVKKTDSIVDLTAYDGDLLNYLEFLGCNNLTFCDICDENIKRAHYSDKYKLNIMNKNDYNNINKKFNFIFLNHTLEHVVDLIVLLENLRSIMDENSLLYIEVPNIDNISLNDNPFFELTYEHVNFFGKKSLNDLFIKNGFECVDNNILTFKYRKNVTIDALYGIYKISKKEKNIIDYDGTIRLNLMAYINESMNEMQKVYNLIDTNKNYCLYGIGLYGVYFLSIFKLNIIDFYDDTRPGNICGKKIKRYDDIENSLNENFLILSPSYGNFIKQKLLDKGVSAENIYGTF